MSPRSETQLSENDRLTQTRYPTHPLQPATARPFLPPPRHHLPVPTLASTPAMPTCRRKRVLLTQPSPALLDALKNGSNKEVYYLNQTGEIFETYEYISSL